MQDGTSNLIEIQGAAARPPLQLIAEDLVIDKPIVTSGGDVFIACSSLKFVGDGVVNTGFVQGALAGATGQNAGSITIIARNIESLKLRTTGQTGGQGPVGSPGAAGRDGRDGAPGAGAQCGGSGPSDPRPGGNGENGGDGGPGGIGGRGLPGGASGNVTIRYVDAAFDLIAVPSGVTLTGGEGGLGGQGGPGGAGGSGGSGGRGGDGITCSVGHHHGDYSEYQDVSVGPAPDGASGNPGRSGAAGAIGQKGSMGTPGRWLAERFASEQDYYDVIVGYLPTLIGGQLRKAELLMMLNRRSEAEALLKQIDKTARGPELALTKLRLACFDPKAACNAYGKPVFWAPVLLKEAEQGRQVLKTHADLRSDLDDLTRLLGEATEVARYRAEMTYRAEQAVRAYEFEKRQIEDRIRDVRNRIERAPDEHKALIERLHALEAQARALEKRVQSLVQLLAQLPAKVLEKGQDLLGSIGAIADNIAGAIVAFETGNWPVGGALVLGGLGELQRGLGTVQDLLNLKLDVENSIEMARQELARLGTQIADVNHQIRQLATREAEDALSQDRLTQTQGLLTSFQLNQDLPSLRRLRAASGEALWTLRVSAAERLHAIRRFIDLRLGRADALQPMSPPGGLYQAFSYEHLLSILSDIQRTVFQAPPLNVVEWEMDAAEAGLSAEIQRLSPDVPTNFPILNVPKFLSRGRVRSVRIKVRDEHGLDVGGFFELSQCGETRTPSKSASFQFDKASWIFRISPGGSVTADERFAYRSLESSWTLKVLQLDRPAARIAGLEFQFQLEIDSTAEMIEMVEKNEESFASLPPELRTGSDQWLADQKQRLATVVAIRDAALGKAATPASDEAEAEVPLIQVEPQPT